MLVIRLFIVDFLYAVSPCDELGNNFKKQSELIRRKFQACIAGSTRAWLRGSKCIVSADFIYLFILNILVIVTSPQLWIWHSVYLYTWISIGFFLLRDCKGVRILRRELTSPGLISILAGLKKLLMKCDIWVWIIYVNEFSFRSKLLAFCPVFGFPLSLRAKDSYGCHLCNQLFLSVQKIV